MIHIQILNVLAYNQYLGINEYKWKNLPVPRGQNEQLLVPILGTNYNNHTGVFGNLGNYTNDKDHKKNWIYHRLGITYTYKLFGK